MNRREWMRSGFLVLVLLILAVVVAHSLSLMTKNDLVAS